MTQHHHRIAFALIRSSLSHLPPKADMCGATGDVRFGPIADMVNAIGSPRRRERLTQECETKCLGGLEVDSQLELCRQLNRKFTRLLALENSGHINTSTAVSVRQAPPITN